MLRISALQYNIEWHDPAANRARIEAMLQESPASNVIVLPEMFATGFTMAPEMVAETMSGKTAAWMRHLARKYDALVVGSLVIEEGGKHFNRCIAMTADGVLAQYDKRHLFRMADEQAHYTAGNGAITFVYQGWRIRALVCYDLRFPVWSRNTPRSVQEGIPEMEYDLLLYVANWPERRAAHWDALLRARAIENQAYVVGVNRVGVDGNGHAYTGGSLILGPAGQSLAEVAPHTAQTLCCALDMDQLREYRQKFPAWLDADRFQVEPFGH